MKNNSSICECCEKDENGNWINEPCCKEDKCTSDGTIGLCIHCGAEMFEEKGFWFHHSQEDIPFNEREPQH